MARRAVCWTPGLGDVEAGGRTRQMWCAPCTQEVLQWPGHRGWVEAARLSRPPRELAQEMCE
eukprot:5192374-Pyramimonas_sp.AAC.1